MVTTLPDSPQVRAFYRPSENHSVRLAPPPFPAERMVPDAPAARPGALPLWPCSRVFRWQDNLLECVMACYGRWGAEGFIRQFLEVYPQELAGDVEAAQMPLTADFVLRGEPDRAQYKLAIEQLLSLANGIPMALVYRSVSRPVIALTGTWAPVSDLSRIEIYGPSVAPPIGRAESGSLARFAQILGDWIGRIVIIEASGAPSEVSWQCRHIRTGTREQGDQCRDADLVCKRVVEQTGLVRIDKTAEVTQLFVEPSCSHQV